MAQFSIGEFLGKQAANVNPQDLTGMAQKGFDALNRIIQGGGIQGAATNMLTEIAAEEARKGLKAFKKEQVQSMLQQEGGAEVLAQSLAQTEAQQGMESLMSLASPEQLQEISQPQQKAAETKPTSTTSTAKASTEDDGQNVFRNMLQGFALGGLGATSPAALNFISQREQRAQEVSLAEMANATELAIATQEALNVDPLSVEASKSFSQMLTGQEAVQTLGELLQTDRDAILGLGRFAGRGVKSEARRKFELALARVFENELRLTSGGAITEEEIKKQAKEKAVTFWDTPGTIAAKLNDLSTFFGYMINTADPTGVHRQRATGNKGQTVQFNPALSNISREDRINYLRSRGVDEAVLSPFIGQQ